LKLGSERTRICSREITGSEMSMVMAQYPSVDG
jgi:hypothetical protein